MLGNLSSLCWMEVPFWIGGSIKETSCGAITFEPDSIKKKKKIELIDSLDIVYYCAFENHDCFFFFFKNETLWFFFSPKF